MHLAAVTESRAGLQSPLLERGDLLALLTQRLEDACAGRGSVTVLEGTYGLGKSSILRAAESQFGGDGALVLTAAGRDQERELAFGVLLQLFEAPVALADPGERTRLLSGAAALATPLLVPAGDHAPIPERASLLRGLHWLCRNLAAERPLLLLVDDADMGDSATLEFLLYLGERVEDLPLALVLARGSAIAAEAPGPIDQLAAGSAAIRCRLEPLSGAGTGELLRSVLGPELRDGACRVAQTVTGGNPLLAQELATELVRSGTPVAEARSEHVRELGPPPIAASVMRRTLGLGPDAASLLRAIAVLGDGAELRHAAELAGLERSRAAKLIDGLASSGLLRPDGRAEFAQPIVGVALEAAISFGERTELHLRAARMLEEDEAPAEQVAAHLLRSGNGGSGWVVDALRAAAAAALARGAPGLAVSYLRRALDEPPPREQRTELVLELGRAEATAGKPEAVTRLTEGIERASDPRERAHTALQTGRTLVALGRLTDADAALERGLREAEEDADSDLSGRLRAAHKTIARLVAPDGWAGDAGPVPAASDTPAKRALLAHAALEAALRGAPRDEVVDLAARALARGALLDDETADGITYYLAGGALILGEDLSTAEAALTAAVEEARSRGSVLGFATASLFRSLAIMRRGRITDAAADMRNALAAERYGWRLALPSVHAMLADVLIETGDAEAAWRHIERGEQATEHEPSPGRTALLAARGRLNLVGGEPERALPDLLACGERLMGAGVVNPAVLPWRADAARAHALLGRTDEALELAVEELELAERAGAPGAIGSALRTLGGVTPGEEGLDLLRRAVERLQDSQVALERARALVDYGAALRRRRKRRAAREPLHHGLDLALRCGAAELVERARGELGAAGARPRRTAVHGVEALTARERQVAALAAEGKSNREIAHTLYVTVKTVEWHLKHAYKKLDVSSRAELRGALGPES